MKNTKNFILVGATLLFSAISTCGFAQEEQEALSWEQKDIDLNEPQQTNYPNPIGEPSIDPTPPESNTLKMDMNSLRQQWDSLYLKGDADNLTKTYTEIVYVRKPDGSIKAKTRAQIKNSFNNKFAKMKYLSYSSQQTDAVMESDGTIRVKGTFVGRVDHIGKNSDPIQITGNYDRNVIFVDGKYKICKHNDIVN